MPTTTSLALDRQITISPLSTTVEVSYMVLDRNYPIVSTIPISASGGYGTISFSISPSLPIGLGFNTSNGSITGTPSQLSSLHYYNIIASDEASQTSSKSFGLEVISEVTIAVTSPSVVLNINQPLTTPITLATASGGIGVRSFSITPTLPAGLTFNTSSGQITGTPIEVHTSSSFTVTVSDSPYYSTLPSTASIPIALSVISMPLLLLIPRTNFVEIYGRPIDTFKPISIVSGNAPYQWTINPPLPSGIVFGTDGSISGIPSESIGPRVTSSNHVINVVDSTNQSASENISLKLSRDNVILSDDCNFIHDYLFDFAGTTATGYGANLKGNTVQVGDAIRASNWDNLINDVKRVLVHQNGNNDHIITPASTGTVVLAATPDRMYTTLQFLEINKSQVHPSQIATMTANTDKGIFRDWTCTNFISTSSMLLGSSNNGFISSINWSFEYQSQINYFFNLGGSIKPEISIVGGRDQDIQGWQPIIDHINTIEFGKSEFLSALASEDLSWKYVAIGSGNTSTAVLSTGTITNSYKTNAVIAKFQIVGSTIIGSVNFVAGLGKKQNGKKKKGTFIQGQYISVSLYLSTDFKTTYIVGNNGGISAQKPQTQLISRYVSASPAPLNEFSFGTGLSSDPQVITLNNNSTFTCVVSNIVLGGYTHGTVTPTTMTIPAHSNRSFAIQYYGTVPGYYKGTISILQNVNPLTLFAEINVGAVNPIKLITTVTNTAIVSQDFLVDHRGGEYEKFEVTFPENNPAGFTYLGPIANNEDKFRVTFDPKVDETNGTFQTTATVKVYPLDSSLDIVDIQVPIKITTDVIFYQALGSWMSALGYDNSCLGLTYDIIGGIRYLTVGIGFGTSLDIRGLQVENPNYGWSTIYRIPINKNFASETLHTKDYPVKLGIPIPEIGDYFGVGNAAGSILTVKNYRGNLEIDLNVLNNFSTVDWQQQILEGIAGAFYYYDETLHRNTQLVSPDINGQTEYFTGFDVYGNTITDLVAANLS